MAAEHCPRCHNWRSASTLKTVLQREPTGRPEMQTLNVNLSECTACGIYWYEDKPEQQWFLGDGRPAS